jgi:hypothetical protein
MNTQPPSFTFTLPAPAPATPPAASPNPTPAPRPRKHPALWLIAIGLLANAAILLSRGQTPDIVLDRSALAQGGATPNTGQLLGARGIYMMPAQLGPATFGLYLLDVDSGTICVYKATPETSHFRLMAARSFKYDRFLEDLNNEHLTPKEVQKLVEDQRTRTDLHSKDDQPTVEQTTRPDENTPDKIK